MFEGLSERLSGILGGLTRRGALTEEDVNAAMREVRRLYGCPVKYNVVWRSVAQGDVPAERVGARWMVRRANLDRIAAALGISVAA